ncbi:MAG: enoyl-ACP reductase [Pirellula sp.]|nr:enoyl-ACP reductase [Pirellula sp.]
MPADFLQLADKTILVCGVANKKSVAWHTARVLQDSGANVVYAVRTAERKAQLEPLVPESDVFICDVERQEEIDRLRDEVTAAHPKLHGLLHSIAFADYEEGPKPFHDTSRAAFLRSVDVSCFSLIALAKAFEKTLVPDASVVAISISTTRMAAENYGFMAPVKAALDSSLAFLAKSFSQFSKIRFNAVGAGLLKTSASAGIPGYVDAYLFAEQATLRKQAVQTGEVANTAAFLLSPRSSGINAQTLTVDAGMEVNYFDRDLVRRAMSGE